MIPWFANWCWLYAERRKIGIAQVTSMRLRSPPPWQRTWCGNTPGKVLGWTETRDQNGFPKSMPRQDSSGSEVQATRHGHFLWPWRPRVIHIPKLDREKVLAAAILQQVVV